MCEKPIALRILPMVRSWYATPKRSATTFLRSRRRHRTTPWTLRSGPVSTISASSASCAFDSRGGWPLGRMSRRTVGAERVEAVNPIAQGLTIHAADPSRLGAIHPIKDRCQRQQPPALVGVFRSSGEPPQIRSRVVRPKLHRRGHGANPPCTMESATALHRKPQRVSRGGRWYKLASQINGLSVVPPGVHFGAFSQWGNVTMDVDVTVSSCPSEGHPIGAISAEAILQGARSRSQGYEGLLATGSLRKATPFLEVVSPVTTRKISMTKKEQSKQYIIKWPKYCAGGLINRRRQSECAAESEGGRQ